MTTLIRILVINAEVARSAKKKHKDLERDTELHVPHRHDTQIGPRFT